MYKKYPHQIEHVDQESNHDLLKHFKGESKGFVQVTDQKWLFPHKYLTDCEHIYNFKIRPDDTWIVTYPRSGTTVTQGLTWLLKNNLNYEEAAKTSIVERFPFIEFSTLVGENLKKSLIEENENNPKVIEIIENTMIPKWKILNKTESPRFIKTHIPLSLLPPTLLKSGCKIVYVARNPKSVAVSYYYLCKRVRMHGFVGDFTEFWNFFQKNLVYPSPYWKHVKEGWKLKDHPNVLFLFYEDIVRDMASNIAKFSNFFGTSYSTKQIEELVDFMKIENSKKRAASCANDLDEIGIVVKGEQEDFIRKGKIAGWSEEFTPELNRIANEWIEENLKNTDMRFPIELFDV